MKNSFPGLFGIVFLVWVSPLSAAAQPADEVKQTADLITGARKLIGTDLAAADSLAAEGLKRSLALDIDSLKAKAYYTLGLTKYYGSRFLLSADYYRKAVETTYGKSTPSFAASCWNNLGIDCEMSDQYEEAVKVYLKSVALATTLGDSLGIYQTYINLGYLSTKIKQYEAADDYLEKALAYFEKQNDLPNLALTYQNRGILSKQKGEFEAAVENYSRASAAFSRVGDDQGMLQILNNEISLGLDAGRLEGIGELIDDAFSINRKLKDEYTGAALLLLQGKYFLARKELKKSEACLAAAEKEFTALNAPALLQTVASAMVGLYAQTGEKAKLAEALEKYERINAEIFKKRTGDRIAEYQAIFEDQKKAELIVSLSKEVETQHRLLVLWILLAVSALISGMIVLAMYLNIRQKERALFDRNMELTSAMAREIVSVDTQGPPPPEASDLYFSRLFHKLNERVGQDKLYLNSDLSVADLARLFGTNEKYISKAIAVGCGGNFSRFVNTLRVNDAKLILVDAEHERLGYDEIASRVGFNNQFTFQRQFKELTGLTPAAFRRINIE